MKGKHVGLYVRVSTMLEGQSTSYEAQLEQEKIIMAHGAASCEVYAERISGSSTARPELDHLLEDCRAGKIDFIYTKNLSRMARNVSSTKLNRLQRSNYTI